MQPLHIVACDVGGSGGKLYLAGYDGERLSLSSVHRFPNAPIAVADGLYWDILSIYSSILAGLSGLRGERVDSFAIDAFSNDYLLLDRGGRPLEMPHTYRDKRTIGMVERMDAFWPREQLYARTGIQHNRMNTLYQWLSLSLNRPELLKIAGAVLFVPDALNYFLTGRMATEYTLASVSQAYSIETRGWDTALLTRIGFPTRLLRPIVPSGSVVGALKPEIASALNMDPITIRTTGGHDTASAIVGVPAEDDAAAYISSGTWSIVGVETDAPVMNEIAARHSLANEGGACGTIRLLKNVNGLWLIQECSRQWAAEGKALSFAEISALAADAPAFGPVVDPDDERFTVPNRMAALVRAYAAERGQSLSDAVGPVARCVFESLAMKYRYTLEILEAATKRSVSCLHIVGGGSENDLLNQLTADYTGKTVLAGPVEATAIGNACVQLIGMGAIGSLAEARAVIRRSFPTRRFTPRTTSAHEAHYARFLALTGLPPR